jgi:glucoside 3-dehydrogenase (cytochrome c) hitch-hiker subunit
MTTTPSSVDLLTRREALRRVSVLLGGATLIGQSAWLTGCEAEGARAATFGASEIALLGEIAETILPATGTPGAKAAGVGPFMAVMVTDAYDPQEQRIFRDGLKTLERECRAANGTDFMGSSPEQRLALLERLDREQFDHMRKVEPGGAPHYFRMMKELTLLGYFTSEIGYTQAMRYAEAPGRFDPCVPYAAGQKAWAPHA